MSAKTPHEWSSDSMLAKAERYAEQMLGHAREDWRFGFWSALCLEMVLRSALAHTSPVLLADSKNWNNLLFALGQKDSGGDLNPKSIDSQEVIARLQAIHPDFTREHANFCVIHIKRRNGDLHSGSMPFDHLDTSVWLAEFYDVCKVLLGIQGSTLIDIFGAAEADTAEALILGFKDKAAKAVNGIINTHKLSWEGKPISERSMLAQQAEERSLRMDGHRVHCPACGSRALVHGTPTGSSSVSLQDGLIVSRQPMLPSTLECKACGLKIAGYSKLNACGFGGTYTSTSQVDPVEYFEDEFRDQYSGLDDDNNEP